MFSMRVAVVLFACLAISLMIVDAVQFRSKLAPKMCAAGKSVWVAATGSGPLHLQPCFARPRVKNRNTLFGTKPANMSDVILLTRVNQNKQVFCLTNNGGPLPALALEKPCLGNATVQWWNLKQFPLIPFGRTDYCWDTLGATQKFSRITLQQCDPSRKSQQWVRVQ